MKRFLKLLWPSSAPNPDPEPEGSWSDFSWDIKNPTSSNTAYQLPEFTHPPPPNNKPLPTLPAEIHLQILEHTDWKDHPTFSLVCKLWRHFLKTSPKILESHYENYNPFYEELWQSSILKNRPRPHLHRVVEHLETFVRGYSGKFYPGKIQLKDPRDRWGGRWDFSKSTPMRFAEEWINPKCRFIKPFDYFFFKDEPIVRYTEGEGEKVNIRAIETLYRSDDRDSVCTNISGTLKFDVNMTVGDYINELSALVNFEESLIEHQRQLGVTTSGNNVIWVSVYSTLMMAVGLRFIFKGVYYEAAKDSFVY